MRRILRILALAIVWTGPGVAAAAAPNIVLILIDDLGWTDLHCQGNDRLDTPRIDRLAEEGARFTDAYSAAPVCSPTRAAILTGMAPARLRITNHISNRTFVPEDAAILPADTRNYLDTKYETIAERLQAVGYATALMGKWHLAGQSGRLGEGDLDYYPDRHGFDLNIGGCALGGPGTFFSPYRIHTLPDGPAGEYLPDRLAGEAEQFIATNHDRPFFLALWNYTVHWPMEAPQPLVEKYEQRLGPGIKDARYAAMIEAMDRSIGRVLDALDTHQVSDNTLVVFTSDNGAFLGVADIDPLREGKGYLYEGGIRVPMIVRWPGRVPAGSVVHEPVISTDLYPTFLAAAELEAGTQPCDGQNLLPLFDPDQPFDRDALYFHYPNYAWHLSNELSGAVRRGRYKLIERFRDGGVELYDLEADLSETTDLSQERPELAARLTRQLHAWQESVNAAMPPR